MPRYKYNSIVVLSKPSNFVGRSKYYRTTIHEVYQSFNCLVGYSPKGLILWVSMMDQTVEPIFVMSGVVH